MSAAAAGMVALVLTARAEPRPPPEDDLLYFVMVDRFADGLRDAPGTVDRDDPQAWHGGDLVGLRRRLDHLEALGVRTLWLGPVTASRQEPIGPWGAYHGYWVRDPRRIEPRFGGARALGRLSRALHRRGMRLVLDLVVNHVDYDAPVRAAHPDWFHPAVDIEDWSDPEQLVRRQVHGLPDLAQERPEVADWLVEGAVEIARRFDVDGYRIDAVRHVPVDFLARLNDALDGRVGEGGFWTVGELFDGNPAVVLRAWREGHFDAMFDFPLRYALVDVACHDAPVGRLGAALSTERLAPDPAGWVTFLDNHDLPRIAEECAALPRRVDLALALLFVSRGTPCLTWGTEVLLLGESEPDNRGDMPWGAFPEGYETPIPALAALRRAHPALRAGRTAVLALEGRDRLAFARLHPDEAAVVLVNRDRHARMELELPEALWRRARVVRIVSVDERAPPRVSTPDEPWDLAETRGRVFAEPRSVEIVLLRPAAPGGLADLAAPPDPVPVEIAATGGPPGARLVAVGADPELGGWSPEAGLPLPGRVAVPPGVVLAFKLAAVSAEGRVEWEPRADRFLLVGDGGAAAVLEWGR